MSERNLPAKNKNIVIITHLSEILRSRKSRPLHLLPLFKNPGLPLINLLENG
ncbi:TPA: hypothetical protein HA351_04480 [Methanosarcinaceae archaeon]|nr:hypothetical protein [Methanosarcinaceae archaeon]